jgi:hypothetical protein
MTSIKLNGRSFQNLDEFALGGEGAYRDKFLTKG